MKMEIKYTGLCYLTLLHLKRHLCTDCFYGGKQKKEVAGFSPYVLSVVTQPTAAKFTCVNLGCHKPASNEVVILI